VIVFERVQLLLITSLEAMSPITEVGVGWALYYKFEWSLNLDLNSTRV
jgi:hypothetical protein